MSDNFKYVQTGGSFTLAGSGASASATTVVLSSFLQIDGTTTLTMTNFGTIGYGTLEPGNSTQEEQISFTGITQNANGTATLTGVKTVLFIDPYTESSGLAKSHPGGAKFVISNTAGFYNKLAGKNDDETISGKWIFPNDDVSNAGIATDTDTAIATAFVTLGQLSRQAISGASNGSTTVKGIWQGATQAQADAKTTTGSTSALLTITPDVQRSTLKSDYVVDTGTPNTYAIAPSPAATAYTVGQEFVFKAISANTGASTLNVNGLGAKNLVAFKTTSLRTQLIRTNYMVAVVYDGQAFQITSIGGQPSVSQDGKEVYGTTATGTSAYAVALVPTVSLYTPGLLVHFKADVGGGHATLNVNGLGAKNILKYRAGASSAVETGDIIANQIATVIYDGTQFLLQNQLSASPIFKCGATTYGGTAASSTQTIAHGLGRIPRLVVIQAVDTESSGPNMAVAYGSYDGTNTGSANGNSGTVSSGTSSTSNILELYGSTLTNNQKATITVDATNINLTWTKASSGLTNNINLVWQAFA